MNQGKPLSSPSRGFILLTREPDSRETSPFTPLQDLGYTLISIPLTRTGPPTDPRALENALRHPESYDWVVFTSARAVRALALAHPEELDALGTRRLGAVGPATAQTIREIFGRLPDLMPEKSDAAHLAEALVARAAKGGRRGELPDDGPASIDPSRKWRVLFPAAEDARPDLPRILSAAGIEVVSPVVYSVVPDPPPLETLLPPAGRDAWSSIVLTSGATARILYEALAGGMGEGARGFLERSRPAVLGPTARAELERHGVRVWLEASRPSLELLALEMRDRLAKEP